MVLPPPKYDSIRTIKILPEYEKILKAEIHERKKNMLQYGPYFVRTYQKNDGLIFQAPANVKIVGKEIMPISARESGELLTPHSFKYCAKVIHEELGNPFFHSHCLRHTARHASCREWSTAKNRHGAPRPQGHQDYYEPLCFQYGKDAE